MGIFDWLLGKRQEVDAPGPASSPPQLAPKPTPPAPSPPPAPRYDIDKAIELMRSLPLDEDPNLVLRVVRKTLRSIGVALEEIIDSARQRETKLTDQVQREKAAIEQLEREIATKKATIESVTAQLTETQAVRRRLESAVESETKMGLLIPPEEVAKLQAEATPKTKSVPPPVPTKSVAPKDPPPPPKALSKPPVPMKTTKVGNQEIPDLTEETDVHTESTAKGLAVMPSKEP